MLVILGASRRLAVCSLVPLPYAASARMVRPGSVSDESCMCDSRSSDMPRVRPHRLSGVRSRYATGASRLGDDSEEGVIGSLGRRMHLKCMVPVRTDRMRRRNLCLGVKRELMSIGTSPQRTCGERTYAVAGQ